MNRKIKLLTLLFLLVVVTISCSRIYAAGASMSINKKSVEVGKTVTVTVKYNAAAWNLHVTGATNGSIVGYDPNGNNKSGTETYTIKASKVGTYTVYLSGDVTDGKTDLNNNISTSVTYTVKEKETTTNTNTSTNSNKTTNNDSNKAATKSSNANISKITLNVEGFKFNSSDTIYNVKVDENVDKLSIGVTLAHSKATYTITGNKDFKVGNNVIKIVVKAEDGTSKTYKINVNKAGNVEETSADLSNLIVENMTFKTPFTSENTEYVGNKIKYEEKLNILVYTVAEGATYEIIGNENLKEGENTIKIIVTSKDKTNTKEYTITFEMMSKEESDALKTISIYTEEPSKVEIKGKSRMWKILEENATIILLYLLALVEFGQVIYLYVQLKNVNPEAIIVRRRNKNK